MIALMEAAACQGLAAHLPPGYTSVGSHVDVRHLAPSALGAHVTARAEVVGIQGSRVIFDVSARHDTPDGPVEIGSGRHVRVIVRRDAFLDPS
jgi:predicted thioesterase